MKLIVIFIIRFLAGCTLPEPRETGEAIVGEPVYDTMVHAALLGGDIDTSDVKLNEVKTSDAKTDKIKTYGNRDTAIVNTKSVTPSELVAFAERQLGVRYKYASINPAIGFDCSGFITYVFNHFNIKVPRSSIDFTKVGKPVSLEQAKPGDLILFTGTDSTKRFVGHMGIIHSLNSDEINFIHSSSGKANGVTITPLNKYYRGRFMTIRRVFPGNDIENF